MSDIRWPPQPTPAASAAPGAPAASAPPQPTPGDNAPAAGQAPEDFRHTRGAIAWTVVFGLILALSAYEAVATLIDGVKVQLDPDGAAAREFEEIGQNITSGLLWANSIIILILYGGIPMAWVALTRVQAHPGTWRYLFMEWKSDSGKRLVQGLGLGILLWLAVIVLTLVQLAIEGNLDALLDDNATADSPLVEAILRELSWPLAIFMALVAGFAEEVFFRGVLQRWIGWWGQAIVFGITHAGYGTWEQIVVPFGLGLLFGWLVKRGYGLWLVIAAHFMFDFVQFALALTLG